MLVDIRTEEAIEKVEQLCMTDGHGRVHEDLSIDQVGRVLRIEPLEEVLGGEQHTLQVGAG